MISADVETRACDSCGQPLDDDNGFRMRHRDCPPPPLSPAALDAIEKAHNLGVVRRGPAPATAAH